MNWIRWFDNVGMTDVASVGGKNASLGEMRQALAPLGIRTPDGFATTADAYRAFLHGGDLERIARDPLASLEISDSAALQPFCRTIEDSVLKTMVAIVEAGTASPPVGSRVMAETRR